MNKYEFIDLNRDVFTCKILISQEEKSLRVVMFSTRTMRVRIEPTTMYLWNSFRYIFRYFYA